MYVFYEQTIQSVKKILTKMPIDGCGGGEEVGLESDCGAQNVAFLNHRRDQRDCCSDFKIKKKFLTRVP